MKRILVANRSEIACRIIHTIKKMGHHAVAIYSEADASSKHVHISDEAYLIGPSPSAQSYLNLKAILSLCQKEKIDAVHPGYGFLSENADFVRELTKAGIVFIGPNTDVISLMGDKITARESALKQNVPVVPGWSDQSADIAAYTNEAQKIGFPVLLKAAGGGGGRGIRIIHSAENFGESLQSVRNEAQKYFSDDRIFLEKYIEDPRHIEIQVLADKHGNIIHLGERECSIQRRYQKLIEETPSPFVDEKLRDKMASSAINLCKAIGYDSAGTVEFIVDKDKNFYFLEVNTRLQVEHPITEMITGVDIVKEMINSAFGKKLKYTQKDIAFKGHAIEARIIAEDPVNGFVPSTGIIKDIQFPQMKNLRIDSGFEVGDRISVYYDSLICKVIAYGKNRKDAVSLLKNVITQSHIEGVETNLSFTNAILAQPAFQKGLLSTHFIPTYFDEDNLFPLPDSKDILNFIAVIGAYYQKANNTKQDLYLKIDGIEKGFQVSYKDYAKTKDHSYKIRQVDNKYILFHEGRQIVATIYPAHYEKLLTLLPKEKQSARHHQIIAPMPGLIVDILVEEGQKVEKGQGVISMEAMKMENVLRANMSGQISKIYFNRGDTVNKQDILLELQ
jgi:propionyl-CoA carboxylase alpha chain